MADYSEQLSRLSGEKRQLLELLLEEEGIDISRLPLTAGDRTSDTCPLSFAQQRLWFLNRLEPDSPFYNVPMAVRLKGALDVAALERALSEIVRRHEVLRVKFVETGGQPAQVVGPARPIKIEIEDLRGRPDREAEAERRISEEARQLFDLSRGPLIRVRLLQVEADESIFLLTMHHIVSDAWSIRVLIGEIGALYDANAHGRPSPLPELPIQYTDFAQWQRAWLRGEVLDRQLQYWKRQLAVLAPVLELPADRPRPPAQSYRGGQVSFTVPADVAASLRSLSREREATMFMTLLAAWQVLLARYSGQPDVAVGTPIANRNRPETEHLIGYFANTLVMRTDLSGDPTFAEVLRRVREVCLDGYAHQDIPFEKLVEELQPERNLSHSPLFQVMFVLQNTPGRKQKLEMPGLKLMSEKASSASTKFDLTLTMLATARVLTGTLDYQTDLFDRATAERMVEHFQALLRRVAENPERRLSELATLTAAECRQLLVEWNNTQREPPHRMCIHELIERQVERTPDAVAVVYEDESLTYSQLDERANRLASTLLKRGVGRGSYVPVLAERSPTLLISFLAVMKTGAAFAPLDVNWPVERLRNVLDELGSDIVLAGGSTPAGEEVFKRDFLDVEEECRTGAGASPRIGVSPADPMYVIYTSGSTGRPKGVVVPHQGIVNRFLWMNEYLGADVTRVTLQTTRPVYDSAIWELMLPLIGGGKTVITVPNTETNADYLAAVIERHGVTITDFVPSVFNAIVPRLVEGAGLSSQLNSLRCAIIGGEEITPATTYKFKECFPRVRVINSYGPTEASIACLYYEVTGGEGGRIPIGKPIANVQVLILDADANPVPVGVRGEIHVAGVCLALGYLNDDEKTRLSFVENGFAEIAGDRLYKTGDLGRWLPDGNIEYLGRLDQQVKIRGLRIELGEIESVLGYHPAVRDVVVLARDDAGAGKSLAAYVVPGQEGLRGEDLRAYAKERLPDYMVPAAFVFLEKLPLTPFGKVDRRALPAPARADVSRGYTAPSTPVEEILASIWAEVLRLEAVGANDNFFELGGHSLLATQVISRIRSTFGFDVPLRAIFEYPTLAGLASHLTSLNQSSHGMAAAPPVTPVSREEPLPLSFAQQRLWFLDQLEPNSSFYNMSSAVRLTGRLDVSALAGALAEVIRRHEALRTKFVEIDGEPRQVIMEAHADLGLGVEDLTSWPESEREAEVARRADEEALRPFELSSAPPLRVRLMKLEAEEHVLVLTMHHILSDGWSMGILVREVGLLYEAYSRGEESPLDELKVQYGDYAVWQREWLQGATLERQLSYWGRQLRGPLPVLELPTDHTRPPMQTYRGAQRAFRLSPEVVAGLKEVGRRHEATLFMTLLAAFQALLHRYTGQGEIIVGTAVAGRSHKEWEPLIGLFANTLALRTKLGGDPSFAELLRRVRGVCLEAYAHQDAPFERLVEELQPARDLGRSPIFQAMLLLQNTPREAGGEGSLRVRPLKVETRTAKMDMLLSMTEGGDGISATWEYNTDLFEAATVRRMIRHLQVMIGGVIADPEQKVSRLQLMPEDEERQVLVGWNQTAGVRQGEECIHRLFEGQAERTPEAIAVSYGDERLTYGELNARANQLAWELRERGAGGEALVGLCVERSVEMVVGILGILKAGGAYVPLDPYYPRERIAFMLKDAGVSLLLTQRKLAEVLPEHAAEVVWLDSDWERIATGSRDNPRGVAEPDNLAYVIYTSGSTGRPKGVMVCHRSAANLLRALLTRLEVGADDVWTIVHSYSFDFSVWEFWGALASGGRLVIVPALTTRTPSAFVELLNAERVTVLNQTPSAFGQLVAEVEGGGWGTAELAIRVVILGGEALPHELLSKAVEANVAAWNFYGPTEATVWTTAKRIEAGDERVAIGGPIANTQVYVLDAHQQPVPVGVAGELYIGGEGLARGYLNRPDVTAERFIPHPFGQPGARLYRTGDRALWLADGNVVFLGRLDEQVKIRGYRIELGEIEAVLGRHPAVRECVVVAREDRLGDKRLVAYVVAEEGKELTGGEAHSFLKRELPEYMLPTTFTFLPNIPLTDNGKVDRRALPAPDRVGMHPEAQFVAPRDYLELQLVRIWEEVMGVPNIGVRDNFFELGGHSLVAVKLLSRIERRLGRKLPLPVFFQGATVERLAGLLRGEAVASSSTLVEIQPGDARTPFFCVHPVGGNVLCYFDLARRLGADQPVYGLQSPGLYGENAQLTRIEDMASHYIKAVLSVQPDGPLMLGGWSLGGFVAYEMTRQLRQQGRAVSLLALFDPGPVSRHARLLEDADETAILVAFAQNLGLTLKQVALTWDQFRRLAVDEQLALILEQARLTNLVPSDTGLAELRHLLRTFEANARALRSYAPLPYDGDARVVIFQGDGQRGEPSSTSLDGWKDLIAGGPEVYAVPGDHYTILRRPNVDALAVELAASIARARPGDRARESI